MNSTTIHRIIGTTVVGGIVAAVVAIGFVNTANNATQAAAEPAPAPPRSFTLDYRDDKTASPILTPTTEPIAEPEGGAVTPEQPAVELETQPAPQVEPAPAPDVDRNLAMTVCQQFIQGATLEFITFAVTQRGYSAEEAPPIISAAVAMYCPQFTDQLGG